MGVRCAANVPRRLRRLLLYFALQHTPASPTGGGSVHERVSLGRGRRVADAAKSRRRAGTARGTFAESAARRPRPREVQASKESSKGRAKEKAARCEHQGGFHHKTKN